MFGVVSRVIRSLKRPPPAPGLGWHQPFLLAELVDERIGLGEIQAKAPRFFDGFDHLPVSAQSLPFGVHGVIQWDIQGARGLGLLAHALEDGEEAWVEHDGFSDPEG